MAMHHVRRILWGIAELGGDAAGLQRELGLDEAALRDPDGRLPRDKINQMWEEAERRTGEVAIGLRVLELARSQPPDHVIGLTALASPTLRDAYRTVARFARVADDGVQLQLESHGEVTHLRWLSESQDRLSRHMLENSMGLLCEIGLRGLPGGFAIREVRFRHGPPPRTEVHGRYFGAPVRFDQPRMELLLDEEQLARPMRGADPALRALLEQHLQSLVDRRPRGAAFADRVRGALVTALRDGGPTVEAVAARLRCSPRTLRRRLQDEGQSFQQMSEGHLSIAEIAFLLGYSEVSAFHRAFRKWSGAAPAEFRRARVSGGVSEPPAA